MRDGYGRTIRYLRLSVTDKCNCRCVYCMPATGVPRCRHEDLLSFEELTEVVRAATTLGVRKVRVTGGEPLARRGVVDLCRMVAAVPGVEELDMTTNATMLAPVAADLRAAGVSRLNVSLDTLRSERYRQITRVGELSDALAGIRAARVAGFGHLKINCVLMGGVNDDEVADFVDLARREPVEVRFIELMPMGECALWPRERFVSADVVLDACPELVRIGTGGVAELYRGPGFAGRVGLIRAVSHRFCSACDRIRVTADGRVKPCLHSADEVSVRGLRGEELERALARAILMKPAHHELAPGARPSATPRDMNEIGG
ncbi:GTP 3',8-cyclase MoaA [Olsenella uli]|uniref:GTP 3',8-cyclase MoaA n=1 Tax=Olsenella uli TaxID=133926 RepID=UPI0012AB9A8F|nr:GTP 3',8-cyclase MoaA [Olsenella uli]